MAKTVFLADKLKSGTCVLSGWSGLAVPGIGELLARGGYEAVTLDLQHGQHDLVSARDSLAALALCNAHGIVRIPVADFAAASRFLDLGADAIIAPMINSAADARSFADFVKYPPLGKRSWGPNRAAMLKGLAPADYFDAGNSRTVSFAMIETPEAVAGLDEILAVPGIDGVFVGPADLSLTVSKGERIAPTGGEVFDLARDIARRTRAAGKFPGIFCIDPAMARTMRDAGFLFLTCGVDMDLLVSAASAVIADIR